MIRPVHGSFLRMSSVIWVLAHVKRTAATVDSSDT